MGKSYFIRFHGKFKRFDLKIGICSLLNDVYEDLWVQEVKVIFRPFNKDSHILTILSIS